MLAEVLEILAPKSGEIVVDCTLGFGGHAVELLTRIGSSGKLIGFDMDGHNLPTAEDQLRAVGHPFRLHHGNYAGFPQNLAEESSEGCDCLLADLGMSSMQVDDASRGFSFMRDGPLDMRMDTSRGRTAAQLVATMSVDELAEAFREIGDEVEAEKIAEAIVSVREETPIERTRQFMKIIMEAAPVRVNPNPLKGEPSPRQQRIRPTARVFQTLRILVNRELANLQELLRVLPWCLKSGGRAALISFHSGEDRLIKVAFREGLRSGIYGKISEDPMRPTLDERFDNPRSRSAKMRWAIRA